MPSPREQPSPNNRRRRPDVMPGGWLWLVILVLLVGILWMALGIGGGNTISYDQFINLVEEGKVAKIVAVGKGNETATIQGELKEGVKKSEALKKQISGEMPEACMDKQRRQRRREVGIGGDETVLPEDGLSMGWMEVGYNKGKRV